MRLSDKSGPAVAAVAATLALALGPAAATATADCPEKNPAYTGACGPTFVLPAWGDAGGWTKPEQYETIQLADVDGDGADELLGRTPTGLAIHDFDTTLGQWRPQVDDQDRPIVLTEFADPAPLSPMNPPGAGGRPWNVGGYPPKTDWTLPEYYDTIEAADIDGKPGAEILARGSDGVIVFKFTPSGDPKAGKGSWKQLTTSGPLKDRDHWGDGPFYYATIGTGDFDGNGDAELFARGGNGPTVLDWNGSSWRTVANITGILSDNDNGREPAYYTSLHAADIDGDSRDELMMRDSVGVTGMDFDDTFKATPIPIPDNDRQFGDITGPDCPFYTGGPCLGAAPAYYGTLQFGNFDATNDVELLTARTPGGMRFYEWIGASLFRPTSTLTDVADGDGYFDQKQWETIQSADLDGDGQAEILARDANGINAWSLGTDNFGGPKWKRLAPSTQLKLTDDPWGSDRSYYATIQSGDVDGDGRDDVIARGPYGIRTWFYDRRGTGGWESYLPYGYPDFPTAGQKAAYAKLNSLARDHGYLNAAQSTIRDIYTGVNEPTADLRALMTNLATIAGCPSSDDEFPQYQSCTLPAGASGFTVADWTAAVNRIVAELYYATNVLAHFNQPEVGLKAMWRELFLDQISQLDAIAQKLKLEAAENTSTEFDSTELFSGILGIGGAVLAVVPGGEPFAAAAEIGSESLSMIPSASESLTGEFKSTLGSLDTSLATGISEANQAFREQSQIIRQDPNLMALVSQLRTRGTLRLDPTAIASAGQQGFSRWVYQTLLPTMYARYDIRKCIPGGFLQNDCTDHSYDSRAHVARGDNTREDFTVIAAKPTPVNLPSFGTPCRTGLPRQCYFFPIDDSTANSVWGPMSAECTYDGTTNSAAWTFGNCNVGVDPYRSIVPSPIEGRSWGFTTYDGNFWFWPFGSARAGTASGFDGGGSAVRLRGAVWIPRDFRLPQARVSVRQLLRERGGAGELADGGRRLPRRLKAQGPRRPGVRVLAGRAGQGPRVWLRLRRTAPRRATVDLRVKGRDLDLPQACSGIRTGIDLADAPIHLRTHLGLRDGRGNATAIALVGQWQCETSRGGALRRLVLRRPRLAQPTRAGLRVRVRGPRRVAVGRRVTFRIVVRNQLRMPAHQVRVQARFPRGFKPLGHRRARAGGAPAAWRLARLRPRQAKVLRIRARVTRSAAGRRPVLAVANPVDRRAAGGRLRVRVLPRGAQRRKPNSRQSRAAWPRRPEAEEGGAE